jgi:hypothetical protein
MQRIVLSFGLIVILACSVETTASDGPRRKIPCKVPANAASCYWTHGRLTYGNGTPAVRLWKIGTNRLLGIYSGPSVDRHSLDNEHPEFPASLARKFDPAKNFLYADFEVCPLEKEKPGAMQASCIASAKNIFVQSF